MFERFTENARRTVFFARYAASNVDSRRIETQHFLQGLMQADTDLFTQLFAGDAGRAQDLRLAIEPVPQTAPAHASKSMDLPLSIACKRVLSYGAEEAEALRHRHIGTEHLLLGLLKENGPETGPLRERGIDSDEVRHYAVKIYPTADLKKSPELQMLHSLVDSIPSARWEAARKLLQGLTQEYFSVSVEGAEGAFLYTFGTKPK